MLASSSKLNSLTVKENVAAPQTLKVMAPKETNNNNKGRDDLSQEKKKACHQCRQKTANFGGACKKKRNKGPCPIRYCARCLLNRYGKQEKVAQTEGRWICPKCRGICNCSCCRKKRGEMPTGMLIHVAKASGCASVHDLLQKGSEAVAATHVNGSLKCVTKRANKFHHEGADLIALLPPVPTKKRRTKLSYSANKYTDGRVPLPRAEDKVIHNDCEVTSSVGAQAGEDEPIEATARFSLFGVLIH